MRRKAFLSTILPASARKISASSYQKNSISCPKKYQKRQALQLAVRLQEGAAPGLGMGGGHLRGVTGILVVGLVQLIGLTQPSRNSVHQAFAEVNTLLAHSQSSARKMGDQALGTGLGQDTQSPHDLNSHVFRQISA